MRYSEPDARDALPLSSRVSPELAKRIEAAAAKELISISAFVRRAVARAVEQQEAA